MVAFLVEKYLVCRCMHGWFSAGELPGFQIYGWFSGRELPSFQMYAWLVFWTRII